MSTTERRAVAELRDVPRLRRGLPGAVHSMSAIITAVLEDPANPAVLTKKELVGLCRKYPGLEEDHREMKAPKFEDCVMEAVRSARVSVRSGSFHYWPVSEADFVNMCFKPTALPPHGRIFFADSRLPEVLKHMQGLSNPDASKSGDGQLRRTNKSRLTRFFEEAGLTKEEAAKLSDSIIPSQASLRKLSRQNAPPRAPPQKLPSPRVLAQMAQLADALSPKATAKEVPVTITHCSYWESQPSERTVSTVSVKEDELEALRSRGKVALMVVHAGISLKRGTIRLSFIHEGQQTNIDYGVTSSGILTSPH